MGLFSKGLKGAAELAEIGGLDKKAAAYLKRLTQRVKEAKTPKGKKLAEEKLMQKQGEALAKGAHRYGVSRAPDPRQGKKPVGGRLKDGTRKITKRPMGGKVYKVDNSGQQMVAKQYGGKING